MTRFTQIIFAAVAAVLGAATAGQAQTIAGTVRDATGAVMPGVTVEAASPALIEKVRSAASDGAGQYRIVNLSPGIYTVTFALAGFTSVKREGIELTGNFTATVNAEMRLGTLEETITVSGVTPLVDAVAPRGCSSRGPSSAAPAAISSVGTAFTSVTWRARTREAAPAFT